MPRETKVDSSLKIASLSARQAIIVALITSLAGIVGAYIGKDHRPAPSATHYIKLKSVESSKPGAVRIIFDVNGQAYSYPSRVLWADVSSSMSQESFPLPNAQSLDVHVAGFFRSNDGGQISPLQKEELTRTPVSALPIDAEARLQRVDHEFTRGGDDLVVRVSYTLY